MLPGLKFARLASGLSQEELSERSGVHRDTIQKLETGQRPARPATIKGLAAALGFETEELSRTPQEAEMENTKAPEKVEVEVRREDSMGAIRGETLRFRGEVIDSYEDRGAMFTLYQCPGGFRVHVDFEDGERAYLNPARTNHFTGETEYPTYTAEELVQKFPDFGATLGVYRVRDID